MGPLCFAALQCPTLGTWFIPGSVLGTKAQIRIEPRICSERVRAMGEKPDLLAEMGTQRVLGTHEGEKRAILMGSQGKLHRRGGYEQGNEGKIGVC